MSETFTRTSSRASFELDVFGRLYRDAYDPEVEIEAFERALLTMARTRQIQLHGATSVRLQIALDQLLPLRASSARRDASSTNSPLELPLPLLEPSAQPGLQQLLWRSLFLHRG